MGCLPLDQFLCWKLKIATIAFAIQTVIAAFFAALLEVLDIASQADKSFIIQGGFAATWRMHVWEGWLACNIVMLICHCVMIGYSILMYFAVKRFPTYYEFNLTKGYLALMICYMIIELGTSLYHYTWYGPNIFRRAYLVFTFMFWVVRTIINFTACLIFYSRISEIDYEILYGERKDIGRYASRDFLIRSGRATPRSGYMTPSSYPTSSYA